MATIKSNTDIGQSKVLSKILPHESADMHSEAIEIDGDMVFVAVSGLGDKTKPNYGSTIWSLAALLEQLPYELCDDDGNSVYLQIDKEDDVYQLVYTDPHGDFESIETNRYEHFVDACYEMIIKLHELNLL